MSPQTLIKENDTQPKVHFSEYLKTEDAPGEDAKPEESTQPAKPEAE